MFRFEIVMEKCTHRQSYQHFLKKLKALRLHKTAFLRRFYCILPPLTRLKKGKTTIRENPKEKAEKNSY